MPQDCPEDSSGENCGDEAATNEAHAHSSSSHPENVSTYDKKSHQNIIKRPSQKPYQTKRTLHFPSVELLRSQVSSTSTTEPTSPSCDSPYSRHDSCSDNLATGSNSDRMITESDGPIQGSIHQESMSTSSKVFYHGSNNNSSSMSDGQEGRDNLNGIEDTSISDSADAFGNNDRRITIPGDHDVLFGRGKGFFLHPGNVRFRALVQTSKQDYCRMSSSRKRKTSITRHVMNQVKCLDPPGKFLVQEPNEENKSKQTLKDQNGLCPRYWVVASDTKAFEKTSQALRQMSPRMKRKTAKAVKISTEEGKNGMNHVEADKGRNKICYDRGLIVIKGASNHFKIESYSGANYGLDACHKTSRSAGDASLSTTMLDSFSRSQVPYRYNLQKRRRGDEGEMCDAVKPINKGKEQMKTSWAQMKTSWAEIQTSKIDEMTPAQLHAKATRVLMDMKQCQQHNLSLFKPNFPSSRSDTMLLSAASSLSTLPKKTSATPFSSKASQGTSSISLKASFPVATHKTNTDNWLPFQPLTQSTNLTIRSHPPWPQPAAILGWQIQPQAKEKRISQIQDLSNQQSRPIHHQQSCMQQKQENLKRQKHKALHQQQQKLMPAITAATPRVSLGAETQSQFPCKPNFPAKHLASEASAVQSSLSVQSERFLSFQALQDLEKSIPKSQQSTREFFLGKGSYQLDNSECAFQSSSTSHEPFSSDTGGTTNEIGASSSDASCSSLSHKGGASLKIGRKDNSCNGKKRRHTSKPAFTPATISGNTTTSLEINCPSSSSPYRASIDEAESSEGDAYGSLESTASNDEESSLAETSKGKTCTRYGMIFPVSRSSQDGACALSGLGNADDRSKGFENIGGSIYSSTCIDPEEGMAKERTKRSQALCSTQKRKFKDAYSFTLDNVDQIRKSNGKQETSDASTFVDPFESCSSSSEL